MTHPSAIIPADAAMCTRANRIIGMEPAHPRDLATYCILSGLMAVISCPCETIK